MLAQSGLAQDTLLIMATVGVTGLNGIDDHTNKRTELALCRLV